MAKTTYQNMSEADLTSKLTELRKDIRTNEFLKAAGGLNQSHVLPRDRREVARILTELSARKAAAGVVVAQATKAAPAEDQETSTTNK